jgi:hypothetical protein
VGGYSEMEKTAWEPWPMFCNQGLHSREQETRFAVRCWWHEGAKFRMVPRTFNYPKAQERESRRLGGAQTRSGAET